MDVENVPQWFNTVRTFFPLTGFWTDECADTTPRAGKAATFALQLFFRRNTSWQGSVTWLEKGKREFSQRAGTDFLNEQSYHCKADDIGAVL